MKIFRKKIKEQLNLLTEQLANLKNENNKLSKIVEDRNIYTAIGMPYVENYDKRIILLMEANQRGFFNDENYFIPVDGEWSDSAYFKHHYSDIAYNYGYDKDDDSLRVPVIGIKGNISVGRVCIYKNGIWSSIIKI